MDSSVFFPDESNIEIIIPSSNEGSKFDEYARKNFPIRFQREVLLRRISSIILNMLPVPGKSDVIDIGCWIGDNSLVWSKMIEQKKGRVLAIDPSQKNIDWIDMIADKNKINNLITQCSICSYKNDINFTHFRDDLPSWNTDRRWKETKNDSPKVTSSRTLDELASECLGSTNSIFLMHLDVEKMEVDVLKGAHEIVNQSKPFIFFEAHLLTDRNNLLHLKSYFKSKRYRVYMLNEVTLGTNLDCRNFLAIPEEESSIIDVLQDMNLLLKIDTTVVIPATDGSPLIPC
ncbi:FkbM family methyltransferase [Prochlorococcus marinus]|uniref:FkbM family methyltransferase n=1 Tax=Prochlorococcus marinus TaxID=1219 RepID=UPI0022B5B100|nr:FkbM family methyltransferase [Prochlorococcus marinus]